MVSVTNPYTNILRRMWILSTLLQLSFTSHGTRIELLKVAVSNGWRSYSHIRGVSSEIGYPDRCYSWLFSVNGGMLP
jgi:hypothetical protein